MSRANPAIGYRHGCYQRKTVCLLDDETFAEIRGEAVRRGRSFSHILREVVEIGLETIKEEKMQERIYINGRRFHTERSPYYTLIIQDDGVKVKWSCPCCGDLYSQERFATKEDAMKAIEVKLGRGNPVEMRPIRFCRAGD